MVSREVPECKISSLNHYEAIRFHVNSGAILTALELQHDIS